MLAYLSSPLWSSKTHQEPFNPSVSWYWVAVMGGPYITGIERSHSPFHKQFVHFYQHCPVTVASLLFQTVAQTSWLQAWASGACSSDGFNMKLFVVPEFLSIMQQAQACPPELLRNTRCFKACDFECVILWFEGMPGTVDHNIKCWVKRLSMTTGRCISSHLFRNGVVYLKITESIWKTGSGLGVGYQTVYSRQLTHRLLKRTWFIQPVYGSWQNVGNFLFWRPCVPESVIA